MILPILKKQEVGAYNWGLCVSEVRQSTLGIRGRSKYTGPPTVWFFDIVQSDGSACDPAEANLIQGLTGKQG
jgi:hypothetical protein